jgi:tetratricopeptide (TPR) repeat protein
MSYRENELSRACRWLVSGDAVSLIHAFIQSNAAASSETPDIFLRFVTPFSTGSSYGENLSQELSSMVEADREALAKDGIEVPWSSEHRNDPRNAALGFIRNLFHFALSLDLEPDDRLVACLTPTLIQNPSDWKKWWTDALSLQLPPQIRLLVCETPETNFLESLSTDFPQTFTTLHPPIDGTAVMRQLMDEYGDPNDPATRFRKAFLDLSQWVGKGDAHSIRNAAKTALDLARSMERPQLEVAVFCTAGNGLAMAGELEQGLQCFDQARSIARSAVESLYHPLVVHAAFFKGGALIGAERYEQAAKAYEEAAIDLRALTNGKSTNPALRFLLIEALRMSGLCREKSGEKTAASPFYEEALQLGERLDAGSRKQTTLAYCGQSLIAIYKFSSQKNACLIVQEKMNALLGAGWEKSLPQRAA